MPTPNANNVAPATRLEPDALCDTLEKLPGTSQNTKEASAPAAANGPAGDTLSRKIDSSLGMPAFVTDRSPIAGYEIESVLGRGGMGVVYKARHTALKRTVAIKMVLDGRHASKQQLTRFRVEAEAVARLQHPNIVQIYEVGQAQGHPYCVLEFAEGGSLAGRINGTPMDPIEAVQLVETIARAMQLAHSRNVVHRDLKPANILLTADGTPKVTDFGLARQLDIDSGETQLGEVVGTPSYMAPEQASGNAHAAGPSADVYALGAILYDCLAGRPPFKGKVVVETLDQVRTRDALPPSHWRPGLPLDLDTICLKCLRKEPEKRYASAKELADELARYQRGEPILARPVGRVERAVKWVRRNKISTLAVVAVLFALAGGTSVSYLKYLDAENHRQIAEKNEQEALWQADRAEKARNFLVGIFRIAETDEQGGNVTARQILADAEKRIPLEFARNPKLRVALLAAIADVNRSIRLTVPMAMILEAQGTLQIRSSKGVSRQPVAQALLFPEDRITLGNDGRLRLYFLSDLHQEWLESGNEVVLGSSGCEPASAVSKRTQDVLMTFVPLKKGHFYCGWDGARKGIKTEIGDDFEMAVHAVTQGQWKAVMGGEPSWYSRLGHGMEAVWKISDEELKLFPVEMVSWDEIQEFLRKLNELERGKGYLYRLPTEVEWEYACRGGMASEENGSHHFYLNEPTDDLSSTQANFNGVFPAGKAEKNKWLRRTTRVGAYPPNSLGLCDMHGNVWQFCSDLWDAKVSPIDRASRGGSWTSAGPVCQASKRDRSEPGERYNDTGFRLVRVAIESRPTERAMPGS